MNSDILLDLNSQNLPFVEQLLADYTKDPASLPDHWRVYFDRLRREGHTIDGGRLGPSFQPATLFNPHNGNGARTARLPAGPVSPETLDIVNLQDRVVSVMFDDLLVNYDQQDINQLQLAYAMTIHKSQGSEYPCAVIVMHSTHYIMLRRNLLYTALTRAQKLAVIVGNSAGVMRAALNTEEQRRYTRLAERLRGVAPIEGAQRAMEI